ncbi:MAG TPA: VWA domain-containing protein [Bryobacteraceae bacterium]|nr:VWA domain-containing protein [Bryobacteraceae bacterium]
MKRGGAALVTGWVVVLAPLLFYAQDVNITPRPKPAPKEETLPKADIRVTSNLVLIPVSVNDPLNRPVSGLEKENFKLYDDKVLQKITTFAMDDEPIAAGLVFDTSGSMGEKLKRSRMAAAEFFKIADPDDEFFLVEFDNQPRLMVPLTKDYGTIEEQLTFSRSKGSTALLDAIYMGLHEIHKSTKNKRTLLVISDGGDNNSRYTLREVKDLIQESDVLIYAIGVFGGGSTPEEAGGPDLLSHIAEQTGGRMFYANPADLPDVAKKIGIELRNRYILGYAPENEVRDGKYHHVEVKVIPPRGLPKLQAHWRVGYNAPDH